MTTTNEVTTTDRALAEAKPKSGIKIRSRVRAGRRGDEPFNPQPDPPG